MANYLEADYIPQEPAFVPNYNLINMALQTRQSQYDQGFSQLKSLYNSVLSSKVTNDGNAEQQKVYLKNIEDGLKNLPSVDLSIDKNVNSAKNLFSPFYNDKELMRDISLTKVADDQLSLGQSYMSSSDEKKRAMHSSISDEYVGITLDELKRSKRGDGSLMKVAPRYYVPAVNLTDMFKDFITKSNLSPVSQTRDGKGAIFSTSGGKLMEMPLRSLFDGLVTGDQRKYFDAWGEVLYNRQIKAGMASGLDEKTAKDHIATDLTAQTLQYYNDDLNSNQQAYDRAKAIWENYKKTNSVNGNVPKSDEAYQYMSNMLYYQDQVKDLKLKVGSFDPDKTKQNYLNQGASYWGNRLYDDALTKVVRGYAGLTATSKVESDDSFWKREDIIQKELDRQNSRDIAQMRINASKNALTSGGTLTIDPVTGELTIAPAAASSSSGSSTTTGLGGVKLSESEQKLREANSPDYLGLQNVPKPTKSGFIDILYNTRNQAEQGIIKAKNSFIEKSLVGEFPDVSKVMTQVIKEQADYGEPKFSGAKTDNPNQWQNKGLAVTGKDISKYLPYASEGFNNAVKKDPSKDIPAVSQREQAIKGFMQKYGKDFLEYNNKNNGQAPTYQTMFNFLYEKARDSYLAGRSSINNNERNDIDQYLMVIDKNAITLDRLNKDASTISNTLLDPSKKIVNPLMVVKNEQGNWRMKTKEEIEQELKYYSEEVGRTQEKGSPYRDYYQPSVPILRDQNLAVQYRDLLNSYDKNIESFNKTVNLPSSLSFTDDQFQLKQYGVYQLRDIGSIKGENAESAIQRLLYIADNDYLSGTDKRTQLEKSVDESIFEGIDKAGVKSALQNILNSVSTSDKNHIVQYLQFTGIPKDERKGYIIRFDDDYMRARISEMEGELGKKAYQKTISGADASEQIKALKAIQENGLKIFTGDQGIAGSVSGEYNIFERALQNDMKYSTPDFLNDRYQYNVVKLSDGTYELRGKYFVKDLDQNNNVVNKEINLAGSEVSIRFPFKSSFTSIIKTTNDWITEQLKTAEQLLNQKRNALKGNGTPGSDKTISETDLEKEIRLRSGK